jgi:citronellol/citronellal dehydrogenase
MILMSPSREHTGKFYIDDEVLRSAGEADFSQYRDAGVREEDLLPDFFL